MLMTLSHQCDKHSIWLLWLVGYVVGQWVKNTAFVEEPKKPAYKPVFFRLLRTQGVSRASYRNREAFIAESGGIL